MKTENNQIDPRELEKEVIQWINLNFNFISVGAYEKVTDGMLDDYIIKPFNYDSFLNEYNLNTEYVQYYKNSATSEEFCELHNLSDKLKDIDKFNNNHYPMHDIIFESRGDDELMSQIKRFVISHPEKLGMIEKIRFFNEAFFIKNTGFDFVESLSELIYKLMDEIWVPMYKSVMGED